MKTSTIVRKVFAAGDMVRDAGLKTPEDVQRFDDIVYGEDKVWQSLDVYRPKETNIEEKLPVIVSVHGGGYSIFQNIRYPYARPVTFIYLQYWRKKSHSASLHLSASASFIFRWNTCPNFFFVPS